MIADNTWAAIQGRDALKIEWDDGPHAGYSTPTRTARSWRPRRASRARSCASKATSTPRWPSAAKTRRGRVLHAPPRARADGAAGRGRAGIRDGKGEAWACAQSPQAAHDGSPSARAADENVTVNVTLLGGGFGRKSKPDFVVEAALPRKEMDGAPVKVIWTREDDIHHGFYHTVSVERLEAGLDDKGQAGRVAAPQRRADHRLDLRARPEARAAVRARHGPRQHAVRRSRTSGPRTRRPWRMPGSAGSARSRTFRTPSRSSPSSPSSRMRPDAIRRTTCSI